MKKSLLRKLIKKSNIPCTLDPRCKKEDMINFMKSHKIPIPSLDNNKQENNKNIKPETDEHKEKPIPKEDNNKNNKKDKPKPKPKQQKKKKEPKPKKLNNSQKLDEIIKTTDKIYSLIYNYCGLQKENISPK